MTTQARPQRKASGAVRITLPASIAYSPDRLKKSIASIAEQIGHPSCFSGADCFFQMEREFVVNPEGRAVAVSQSKAAEPQPEPWHMQGLQPASASFSVGLSSGVKYDLDKVLVAVDKVIDLIGPHPCISGFDVRFWEEIDWIVVNDRLEAQHFGEQFLARAA